MLQIFVAQLDTKANRLCITWKHAQLSSEIAENLVLKVESFFATFSLYLSMWHILGNVSRLTTGSVLFSIHHGGGDRRQKSLKQLLRRYIVAKYVWNVFFSKTHPHQIYIFLQQCVSQPTSLPLFLLPMILWEILRCSFCSRQGGTSLMICKTVVFTKKIVVCSFLESSHALAWRMKVSMFSNVFLTADTLMNIFFRNGILQVQQDMYVGMNFQYFGWCDVISLLN